MTVNVPLFVESLPYGTLPILDGRGDHGDLACVTFHGARIVEKRQKRHCLQMMQVEDAKPEIVVERIIALGHRLLGKCAFPCTVKVLMSSFDTIGGFFTANFAICCFETTDEYDLHPGPGVTYFGVLIADQLSVENPELEKVMCVYTIHHR